MALAPPCWFRHSVPVPEWRAPKMVPGTDVPNATAAPGRTRPFQAFDAETAVLVADGRVTLRANGPAAVRRAEEPFDAARVAAATAGPGSSARPSK